MTNEFNDLVTAFARVTEKKIKALQAEFEAAADKIMLEMVEALNETEKKTQCDCPPKMCECNECGADVDLYDDEEEFETVSLNGEEFCADDEPCNIVTIYAKRLDRDICVSVEYDKEMGSTGAMAAVVNALNYVMLDSMNTAGIPVKLEHIESLVSKAITEIVVDAAIMSLEDEINEEVKSND